MTDTADFYPPAPANVPAGLTRPTAAYRLRVLVVLTSLFLFVALYLGLVIGSGYFCYYGFAHPGASARQASTLRNTLDSVARTDTLLLATFSDAVQKAQHRTIDEAAFLRIVEQDVLPRWRAAQQQLAQITDVSAGALQHQQFTRYMELREQAWTLLCRAIRESDAGLMEQSKTKMQQADQLARQSALQAAQYRPPSARSRNDTDAWWIIAGIISGVLCLFLVKGLFKFKRITQAPGVEVTAQEQPQLFAFIGRLCRETRAPMPHRVYLSPDVNAAVFYHESILRLFLPGRKNLLIGLGLVNQLNLSEFKAVLAHEFGHFSQSSMKLGT